MDNKFISHSLNKRNLKHSEGESIIEVSEDILNQLYSAHHFSKNKSLFIFSTSKELGIVKIKRKKSIKEFGTSNDK